MRKKQRKILLVKYSVVFSFCFFSSLSASFEDLLNSKAPYPILSLDKAVTETSPAFSKENKLLVFSSSLNNYYLSIVTSDISQNYFLKEISYKEISLPSSLISLIEKNVSFQKKSPLFSLISLSNSPIDFDGELCYLNPNEESFLDSFFYFKTEKKPILIQRSSEKSLDFKESKNSASLPLSFSEDSTLSVFTFPYVPSSLEGSSFAMKTTTHINLDKKIEQLSIHAENEQIPFIFLKKRELPLAISPIKKTSDYELKTTLSLINASLPSTFSYSLITISLDRETHATDYLFTALKKSCKDFTPHYISLQKAISLSPYAETSIFSETIISTYTPFLETSFLSHTVAFQKSSSFTTSLTSAYLTPETFSFSNSSLSWQLLSSLYKMPLNNAFIEKNDLSLTKIAEQVEEREICFSKADISYLPIVFDVNSPCLIFNPHYLFVLPISTPFETITEKQAPNHDKDTLTLAHAFLEAPLKIPSSSSNSDHLFSYDYYSNPIDELADIFVQNTTYPCSLSSTTYLPSDDFSFLIASSLSKCLHCTDFIEEDFSKKSLPNYFCSLEIDQKILNKEIPALLMQHQELTLDKLYYRAGYESVTLAAYQKRVLSSAINHAITIEKQRNPSSYSLTAEKLYSPSLFYGYVDTISSKKHAASINNSFRNTSTHLESVPSLQRLETYSISDEFNIDLQITPNVKEGGYLFAITLEPTHKLNIQCPQNFLFLIDRSGSTDKTRFQTFKQAVSKSLLYLNESDTFNILTFDTEITKMSHESVFMTNSTKHGAKRFLESQKRGYQFVLPNLSEILLSITPMIKQSELPTTVILLTNNKTLDDLSKEDPALKKLLRTNSNAFTLFTAGCSENNTSSMLEMMSHLNRGEYMHSQTNAAFPRKLAALVKHATYLAASNIHLSIANKNSDAIIELFPEAPIAPNLYGDRPYTIIGKINKLSDFDLVLQGRFCENWILLKKKISFSSARHGGHSIYKDYKTYMAYDHYHQFLKEGNLTYLDEAKKTLQPLK